MPSAHPPLTRSGYRAVTERTSRGCVTLSTMGVRARVPAVGVGAVVAAVLVATGAGTPVSAQPSAVPATGPAAAAATPTDASPAPRPESEAPEDTRGPLSTGSARHSGSTTQNRTIAQRLAAAGSDPALGSRVSAVVIDATTGAVVYSRNASLALMPASNQKVTTAFVAISSMPRTKTLTTQVRTNASRSTVWLVGGGDPGLTVARAREMAGTTRSALVAAGVRSVAVRVDDTMFPPPTMATGWKTSYMPGDVVPVRALVVGGRDAMDTGLDAGVIFANELKRLGIAVSSTVRGTLPSGTTGVTSATSSYVGTLTAQFLNASINDYAENLHRHSSRTAGKGTTWAAANGHALAVLRAKGVNTTGMAIHDGSGLSRSDRSSAATMASVLLAARRDPAVNQVFTSSMGLPVAGVSGTLKSRFAVSGTTCARGLVRAKTGWLSDVVSLSGTARGVDGRDRIFSIIENGAASPTEARYAIERFATAATGCTSG